MAEVIDLKGRKARDRKRLKARAMRRAQAVAGAMSCGMCPHRCARCGMGLEDGPAYGKSPWPMCSACYEEYLAYKRYKEGLEDKEAFWHTLPNGLKCGGPGWNSCSTQTSSANLRSLRV